MTDRSHLAAFVKRKKQTNYIVVKKIVNPKLLVMGTCFTYCMCTLQHCHICTTVVHTSFCKKIISLSPGLLIFFLLLWHFCSCIAI